jgi:NTP pyrophosphatase (non-canonical NTP hydrolase)
MEKNVSDLKDLQTRALEIRAKYSGLNAKDGHDKWDGKEYMMGFVGDIGDLTKLVMAKENLRHIDDVDAKLAHELSDCLWSVFVIANQYNIDMETEFLKTMDELKARIDGAEK